MLDHEYSLVGALNRVKVGRYLSIIAAAVSAGIVFVMLSVVRFIQSLGLPAGLTPPVLSGVGAGAVFVVLYWIFNRYAWRWPLLTLVVRVPHLAGDWKCAGKTFNSDGSVQYEWNGTVTIFQHWDKIRVKLRTAQSGSDSIAAALVCDDSDGFRLLYNYRNEPGIGETTLTAHHGFCDLIFSKDLKSADGEYFNGRGRNTFGAMHLARK